MTDMQIIYQSSRVKTVCTNFKKASKKYGNSTALSLMKCIQFINNAESLNDIINHSPFNFHRLQADLKEYCSIDIEGRKSKWRLYIIPIDENYVSLINDYNNKKDEIIHIKVSEVKDHG
ncbi:hypothetical protein [Staphylococcus caprae]|uniref:hypothetical protein n=1 Tax=Staphylococcus caprae TaxID=29380 RepID=UPI003B226FAB